MPDDLIAMHESGHAFLSCVLNLPLARVQLNPPRYDLVADDLRVRDPASRRSRLMVLMGGCAAEEIIFGCARGGGSDDIQIAELLRDGDDESALRDQVRTILQLNQGTLRWLASKLARRGMLSGAEVERFVRGRTLPHGHP